MSCTLTSSEETIRACVTDVYVIASNKKSYLLRQAGCRGTERRAEVLFYLSPGRVLYQWEIFFIMTV